MLKHAWHVGSAIKVLLIKSASFVKYNVVDYADLELQGLIDPLGLMENQPPHSTREEAGPVAQTLPQHQCHLQNLDSAPCLRWAHTLQEIVRE